MKTRSLPFPNLMKRYFFALALALLVGSASGYGQESTVGVKVTTTLLDDGGRTDMETNREAHTAESKTYNSSKKLIQRSTFTLNDQGQAVEAIVYNSKGEAVSQIAYGYDALGRVSEQIDKTPRGVLVRRLVYSYDTQGRVSAISAFDSKGNEVKSVGSTNSPSQSSPKKKARSGGR